VYSCTKFGENPSTGASGQIGIKYNPKFIFYTHFLSDSRTVGQTARQIFTLMAQMMRTHAKCAFWGFVDITAI